MDKKLWVSRPFLDIASFTYGSLEFTETVCYIVVGDSVRGIILRKSARRFVTADKRVHTTFLKALAHWCDRFESRMKED
jgi:hypothetical protein